MRRTQCVHCAASKPRASLHLRGTEQRFRRQLQVAASHAERFRRQVQVAASHAERLCDLQPRERRENRCKLRRNLHLTKGA